MRRTTSGMLATVTVAATTIAAALLTVGSAPQASAATSGSFTASCGYVGSSSGDPIIAADQSDTTWVYDYFGNRSINARSTYASLARAASSCPQGDRAAYWTPALYRDGAKIAPARLTTSYTNPLTTGGALVEPFPADFKMVSGDPNATDDDDRSGIPPTRWGCAGAPQTTDAGDRPPATCPSGEIEARISFPSCWDGIAVPGDANRDGHLTFPSGGRCPDTHRRVLPTVRMTVGYAVGPATGPVSLSPDDGAVFALHAGFRNAWDPPKLASLVKRCFLGGQDCGHFTGTTPALEPTQIRAAQPAPDRAPGGRPPADRSTAGGGTPATAPPVRRAPTGSIGPVAPRPPQQQDVAQGSPARPVRPPGDRRWYFVSEGEPPGSSATVSLGVLVALFLTMAAVLLKGGRRARGVAGRRYRGGSARAGRQRPGGRYRPPAGHAEGAS